VTTNDERVLAGQAVYTRRSLRFYDSIVHGASNRWLWRCPTAELHALYDRNVSASHIDIGVGTGLFLDRAHWPVSRPAITLVDLNRVCLTTAATRIARFAPRSVIANVLEPLPAEVAGPFQSAGLTYLLHCVPGTIPEKAVVFDHLMPHLAAGARVFGATIVQGDAPRNWAARRLMAIYNAKGVFCNTGDRLQDLEAALAARFEDVRVRRLGCVALFEARMA
jgi:hypothetical protein